MIMGLFGSSKKTVVGTSVARVIDDNALPDAIREGLARDLKEESGQMIEQVMESITNSIAVRADRMYSYGRQDYLYGTPSGSVHSSFAGKEASEAVLQQLTGGPVSLAYYHFGPLNLLHVGWKKLTEEHGYDYLTNQIAALSTADKPVFLKNMRVIVTDATLEEMSNGSLEQWGTPPTAGPTPEKKYQTTAAGALVPTLSYAVDPAAAADYILVDTCWSEKEPVVVGSTIMQDVVKFGTFIISLAGFDTSKDYHQAKYVDHNNHTGYWIYQHGAGNPALDEVFDIAYDGVGHFFPWMYFRFNKHSQAEDVNSEGYKDSKHLAKILNMEYDRMVDGIHDNPDIGDVEQAMMVMAVPADTEEPIERRYLFDFFSGLYAQQKAQGQSNAADNPFSDGISRGLNTAMNRSSMVIQDARFKMALNWKNIIKRKVVGVIGTPGTYLSGFSQEQKVVDVPSLSGDPVPKDTGSKRHWYQHQVSKDVYEEIQIFDLKLTYFIFEQYTTTGDEEDEILLIPVDMAIAKTYTLPERELLYSRALHYVFNSLVVIKLKWYQTGIFRAVLIIVMVVITILSYGATIKGLVAAIVAGTITYGALLLVLIQTLIRQLIAAILIRLFVKVVGVKIAFIAAIVAAVYGGYSNFQYGSVEGLPFANEALSVSTGLTKAIDRELNQDFQDLLGQQSEFEQYVKEQTKLLESTQEQLDNPSWLAPMIVFGESPNDFFQRTVHSGNIGVIGLDAVSSYVDVALTLPKLSDTLT